MKYYIALLFASDPKKHMTIKHFGHLSNYHLIYWLRTVEDHSRNFEQITLNFDQNSLVTLEDSDTQKPLSAWTPINSPPDWLWNMANDNWFPHVTSDSIDSTLTATSIAMMSGNNVICEWEFKN